tara:strand:- start:721 stop:864 length:144 start_codon:yes stop_codon:yes gene_type:complete
VVIQEIRMQVIQVVLETQEMVLLEETQDIVETQEQVQEKVDMVPWVM